MNGNIAYLVPRSLGNLASYHRFVAPAARVRFTTCNQNSTAHECQSVQFGYNVELFRGVVAGQFGSWLDLAGKLVALGVYLGCIVKLLGCLSLCNTSTWQEILSVVCKIQK